MSTPSKPEAANLARELFEEEWELSRRPFTSAKQAALRQAGVCADQCPVQWLERLFEALAEPEADRSVSACRPIIRRLVTEMAGVEARLASERDAVHRAAMDEYACHLMLILDRVQARAQADEPVPPRAGRGQPDCATFRL